ncbi:MAG: M24 family metallopeptidase [Treponemataceae bacterium]
MNENDFDKFLTEFMKTEESQRLFKLTGSTDDLYSKLERIFAVRKEMKDKNIDAVIFHDSEGHRSPAVRYLSGMPSDAIFIVTQNDTVLCPWDINIANEMGIAKFTIPFTNYQCIAIDAINSILKKLKLPENSRIEIEPFISYPDFLEYVDKIPQYDVLCRKEGIHGFVDKLRLTKTANEIKIAREASKITDEIIERLKNAIQNEEIKTELEAAQLIERECRQRNCERTSFETLAAGSSRSWSIHAFPSYTDAPFPGENGLAILDFGVYYKGYSTDVTMTIAKGKLTEKQEKMICLVQEAFDEALKYYKPGMPIRHSAIKVDKIFSKEKMKMPHSLGHGIGLEVHEQPRIKSKLALEEIFLPGMTVTLEPGLYDINEGGVRLENDILITEDGNEVLTHSLILRLP